MELAAKENGDRQNLKVSAGHFVSLKKEKKNQVHSREKLLRAVTACTVALTSGTSIAEIQILLSKTAQAIVWLPVSWNTATQVSTSFIYT